MTYYHLKSIISSNKQQIAIETSSPSFFVVADEVKPYVKPTFSKVDFPSENPSIILVSAMGASGKTTSAHALSFDTGLPVLDLAKHAPVGDRTLTGIITDSYPVERIGEVMKGLECGECGVIIDGIDEARSKASEGSFEAFLNDVVKISKGSGATSVLVLGRSQVLLDAWCYLGDVDASVGLIEIDPFDTNQAQDYIDSHARPSEDDPQRNNYEDVRDHVLGKLSQAFQTSVESAQRKEFLSFVGYPPVLDAIATLLRKERNYYRVQQALEDGHLGDLTADLLVRICNYLLDRDHDEKAVPNFISTMVAGLPCEQDLRVSLYDRTEQCARILAKALSRAFPREIDWGDGLADRERIDLSSRYNESAEAWAAVHPFLKDGENTVRNPVFSAVAIMHCILSGISEYQELAYDYASAYPPTYHLVYVMKHVVAERRIGVRMFNMLIQSSSDLLGLGADIHVDIGGQSWEDGVVPKESMADLSIYIRRQGGDATFSFSGIATVEPLVMGPYVTESVVTLPVPVHFSHPSRVVIVGDCYVSAPIVSIETPDLSVRAVPRTAGKDTPEGAELVLDVQHVQGHVEDVFAGGGITILSETHNLGHPLAKYVKRRVASDVGLDDEEYRVRFLRLKRIFMEFAARGQGGLAKNRDKIENDRVLRSDVSDVGQRVLRGLIEAEIVSIDGNFYRLSQERCSEVLGVSWQQLRLGESSVRLREFLRNV